jgi:cytochrome c oxidase assembly protein subunit 15
MIVHRLAWVALASLIILVIAGATVRVTGSGLGCPDWPTCWGCLIPPTSVDQIDVEKLDLEKFKKHAARKGIDPDTITRETVLESFDPVQTWIEFSNRLAALPLGFATLFLALFSFGAKRKRVWIIGLSVFCLLDVVANAIMGAIVVRSGLQPGIITLHMALAFLLIAVLVTIIWLSGPEISRKAISLPQRRRLKIVSLMFFACLFGEGLLGSQLREQTNELAITAETEQGIEREKWGAELGATIIYKIHRIFSWSLLLTSGLLFFWMTRAKDWQVVEPKLIFAMVVAMMLMGVVLGHVAIYPIIHVLHVGMTSVLLAVTWHWIMRLWSTKLVAVTA